MKTNHKILYLLALASCLIYVFLILPTADASGYYREDRSHDYNYGGYGEQYYISPLMTSTLPYSYNNYPYYSNNYTYWPYDNYYASNYYQNYNYSTLNVSCWVNSSYVYPNQPVTWTARVSGGLYHNYIYTWSGTDNPRSLNLNSINVTYQSPGVKTMNVTVTDANGQTTTAYCGSSVVGQYYYPVPYYRSY